MTHEEAIKELESKANHFYDASKGIQNTQEARSRYAIAATWIEYCLAVLLKAEGEQQMFCVETASCDNCLYGMRGIKTICGNPNSLYAGGHCAALHCLEYINKVNTQLLKEGKQ